MWLEGAEKVRVARVKGEGKGDGERLVVYRKKDGKGEIGMFAFRHSKTHLYLLQVVQVEREVAELHGVGTKIVIVYRPTDSTGPF